MPLLYLLQVSYNDIFCAKWFRGIGIHHAQGLERRGGTDGAGCSGKFGEMSEIQITLDLSI